MKKFPTIEKFISLILLKCFPDSDSLWSNSIVKCQRPSDTLFDIVCPQNGPKGRWENNVLGTTAELISSKVLQRLL